MTIIEQQTEMTIDDVVQQLSVDFPAYTITGGDEAEGLWLRAERIGEDWNWERKRMISAEFALDSATKALSVG